MIAVVTAIIVAASLAMSDVSPVHALNECGFAGAQNFYIGSNTTGLWNDPVAWDDNQLPGAGAINVCVPTGKTVHVPNGISMAYGAGTTLRNFGTIIVDTGTVITNVGVHSTILNSGSIQVSNGASLGIEATDPDLGFFMRNLAGGSISVTTGGKITMVRNFYNNGNIDVSGGTFTVLSHPTAKFIQESGTVTGGSVRMTGGVLDFEGTGAAAFYATGGSLMGTIASTQTVDIACDASGNSVFVHGANVNNNGLFRFRPRVNSAVCRIGLGIPSGSTFTNNGTFVVGDTAAHQGDGYGIDPLNGEFVNGATGSVVINDAFPAAAKTFTNIGSMTINAGGDFVKVDQDFVNNGSISNNGSFTMASTGSGTFIGMFKLATNGSTSGNPIKILASYVELEGSGAAAFDVIGEASLRNPNGPIVIHGGQTFSVSGYLTTGYHDVNGAAVENLGTITVTGSAASSSSLGTFSGGTVFTNKGTVILDGGAAVDGGRNTVEQTFVNAPGGNVRATPGSRICQLNSFTNNGTLDLQKDCSVNGVTISGGPSAGAITALVPARVLDTRTDGVTFDGQGQGAGLQPTGSTTEVQVTGRSGVPADATAAVLNVTETDAQAPGFVTVYPCGANRPNASSLNFVAGSTVPNGVIAKIGTGGKVCLYVSNPTDLIADVAGYFSVGSPYAPLVPARLLDTRQTGSTVDGQGQGAGLQALGSTTEVQVTGRAGVPGDAAAAVLNVTVTEAQGAGYVTVYPCGADRPNASSLNFVTGSTVPNNVIAKVGAGGKVCLYVSNGTHVLADVVGYFAPGPGFSPILPARLLDTRSDGTTVDGQGQAAGLQPLGSITEVQVTGRTGVPANATAAVLNVTVTEAQGAGYVTVFPCGSERPNASSLNFIAGSTVPNGVITKVGAGGRVCLFASNGTHLLADVAGYFSS